MATKTVCACNMLRDGEYETSFDESCYRQIGMETWIEHTDDCISGADVASTLDEWHIEGGITRANPVFKCKYGHTHGSEDRVAECEAAAWV